MTSRSNASCGCPEYQALSRRRFLGTTLGTGAASFLGLLDPRVLFAQPAGSRTADSIILLWMAGGQSHLETWDPKPGSGPFDPINTSVKGIQISELLPRIARQFEDISLIRSLTSKEASHVRARYLMHTGYPPLGSLQHPSLGSLMWKMAGGLNPDLPAYVTIGSETWPSGFLGAAYAPFHIENPDRPAQNLDYHDSVSDKQFTDRLRLLKSFDQKFSSEHRGKEVIEAYGDHYRAAHQLMKSQSVEAFDLSQEPEEVRERYGATYLGQGCLLARRLVQEKVRFIEVSYGGWDFHADNFSGHKKLCRTLDEAVSALLWDLKRLDLLDRTLVLLCSEFGRSPVINQDEGRDHWAKVWSAMIAGGGIVGGKVIGASTAGGHEVAEDPVPVGSLHATLCHALGVDPTATNLSPDSRPIRIVKEYNHTPVYSLFSQT